MSWIVTTFYACMFRLKDIKAVNFSHMASWLMVDTFWHWGNKVTDELLRTRLVPGYHSYTTLIGISTLQSRAVLPFEFISSLQDHRELTSESDDFNIRYFPVF